MITHASWLGSQVPTRQWSVFLLEMLLVCGVAASAQAGSVTFTFDTLRSGAISKANRTHMAERIRKCFSCEIATLTKSLGNGVTSGFESLKRRHSNGVTSSNRNSSGGASDGVQAWNPITLRFQGLIGDTLSYNQSDSERSPCRRRFEPCTGGNNANVVHTATGSSNTEENFNHRRHHKAGGDNLDTWKTLSPGDPPVATAPEPASFLLLGTALFGVGMTLKKRKGPKARERQEG